MRVRLGMHQVQYDGHLVCLALPCVHPSTSWWNPFILQSTHAAYTLHVCWTYRQRMSSAHNRCPAHVVTAVADGSFTHMINERHMPCVWPCLLWCSSPGTRPELSPTDIAILASSLPSSFGQPWGHSPPHTTLNRCDYILHIHFAYNAL